MRFGSLFAGIGGFDLGFERAGLDCAWQCEIDPACREVLARHFPGVPCFEDVKELHVDRGSVDLICGGFPCQDLSVAGRRAGLAGERSGLWHEFHRVLEETRPEWCVIENVPGLLSSHRGNDFAVVLRGLVELGYGVCWRVLDAQYFGVAQRRRRVFVVGHLGDGRAAQVLFERESLCRNPAARGKAREDATPILEAGARTGSGTPAGAGIGNAGDPMFTLQAAHQHAVAETFTVRSGCEGGGKGYLGREDGAMTLGGQPQWLHQHAVANPLGAHTGGSRQYLDNDTYVTHALTAEGADASEDGTGRGTPLVAFQDAAMPREKKQNGIGISEGGPMYTLDGHGAHAVGLRHVVRRLMPVECERLQGFPDGWTDGHSDAARYRMLGNAVAVPVAEWIGRRIAEVG